jgi:hypothetical protein
MATALLFHGGAAAMVEWPGKFYVSGKGVVIFWLGWLLPAAYAHAGMMHSNQQCISVTNKLS